jgi:7,8-dihydropterin-6-yl-methyl-4-(beta-D-ribofuranosyl)aminobenzene 5'-phosphate synthase
MNRKTLLAISLLLLLSAAAYAFLPRLLDKEQEEKPPENPVDEHPLDLIERSGRLTILYDNNPYNESLETAWGFSCLVELDNTTILFDTGGEERVLADNIEALEVDVGEIDCLVFSHEHWDHVGGMNAVLETNSDVTIYMLDSFPSSVKGSARSAGAEVVEVRNATVVYEGVATTGALGAEIEEQALMINTRRGLVILTGCSHPGVVEIVERAIELTGSEVHLVMGGYHLGNRGDTALLGIVSEMRELGVERVAPTHCSGELARRRFRDGYGEDYIEAGVGYSLDF